MSDKIGPVTFRQGEEHPFLGREISQTKDFSEHTAMLIDEEIRRIIVEMEEKSLQVLQGHDSDLVAVAEALLERETLSNAEIEDLLDGKEQA